MIMLSFILACCIIATTINVYFITKQLNTFQKKIEIIK